jgi:mRNA deadenylase 3'-5' endonuclease subunit Ccr4
VQEVDAKLYEEYYGPLMEAAGYSGAYANKEGKVVEGCALFVRNSRSVSVSVSVCVEGEGAPVLPSRGRCFVVLTTTARRALHGAWCMVSAG